MGDLLSGTLGNSGGDAVEHGGSLGSATLLSEKDDVQTTVVSSEPLRTYLPQKSSLRNEERSGTSFAMVIHSSFLLPPTGDQLGSGLTVTSTGLGCNTNDAVLHNFLSPFRRLRRRMVVIFSSAAVPEGRDLLDFTIIDWITC